MTLNDFVFINNKNYWEEEVIRGGLKRPDEHIIRFVNRNSKGKNREEIKILDFGCGGGRNAFALAQEGYQVIAMDYNQSCLDLVSAKGDPRITCIRNNGVEVNLKPNSIDIILAHGSLMYCNQTERLMLLKNLESVLTVDGLFWANWRSTRDSLYGTGKRLEESYFLLNEKNRGRTNVAYCFMSQENLRQLYQRSNLKINSIDEYYYTENNGSITNHWFHVIATKEA